MKITPEISGKISNHSQGLGTVTHDSVESRAQELAVINGRVAKEFTEADWQAAKLELSGHPTGEDAAEEESVAAVTRWDEEPGTSGHHVENANAPDEQTVAELLVHEGVDEAEHDRMVMGSVEGKNQG